MQQGTVTDEWVALPGGELEARRPRRTCERCRDRPGTLCFDCYRADAHRETRLTAAGCLETSSPERFAVVAPFAPVDAARIAALKAARAAAQVALNQADPFGVRRRRAQIAARHASEPSSLRDMRVRLLPERSRMVAAADVRWPEAWLPFLASGRSS